MKKSIKLGDVVLWRGPYGTSPPEKAKITNMTLTEKPFMKHGESVAIIGKDMVDKNLVFFQLDNEFWSYSDCIDFP